MNKSIIILLIITSTCACKSNRAIKNLTIEITTSQDYCGGAPPPDELIQQLRTPKAYTGKLYLHESALREDDGITLELENGKITTSGLSAGIYYVYLAPKLFAPKSETPTPPEELEKTTCKIQHNRKALASFTIDKDSSNISRNLHIVCDPCMEPLP